MKTCKKCQKEKAFHHFYKAHTTNDGYHSKCIDCYRSYYVKQREKKNKKSLVAEQKTVKKAEILSISKLFSNGKVTVKAKIKVNYSLQNMIIACSSNAEADRYIDQIYENPTKMAHRYAK